MPDAPGLELIAAEINRVEADTVIQTSHDHGAATLIVDPERVLIALRWLRDTPGQEYDFCASVHAADYLPAEPRFAVHYELLNRQRVERVHVKALLADPAAAAGSNGDGTAPASELLPEIESCVDLFPTANFQEREVYDFFGIVFEGHPDLRRITMPEDYVGWPQRRDFPIGGEEVLFTHNEVEVPRWFE